MPEPADETPAAPLIDAAPVDMAAIEARIRALRAEVEVLRQQGLTPQTIEVMLTDMQDIWTWCGQLLGVHRQTRDELHTIGTALRDLGQQLHGLREALERRGERRTRWRAMVRARVAELAPPLEAAPRIDAETP